MIAIMVNTQIEYAIIQHVNIRCIHLYDLGGHHSLFVFFVFVFFNAPIYSLARLVSNITEVMFS